MRRSHEKRKAFTIVELLVVVFIITVLIAMLMPALASAREAARRAVCAHNLNQIGVAVVLYRLDNVDWFFPVGYPTRPDGTTSYFFGEKQPDGTLDTSKGYLIPYLEEGGMVDQCPSFREGDFKSRFQVPGWGYGYNYKYLGENGEAFTYTWAGQTYTVPKDMHAAHSVRKSIQTVMFADSARINTFTGGATPDNPSVEENYYLDPPSTGYDTVHFRHGGRANVLFVDGHVEAFRAARWYRSDGVDTAFGQIKRIGQIANDDELFDRD